MKQRISLQDAFTVSPNGAIIDDLIGNMLSIREIGISRMVRGFIDGQEEGVRMRRDGVR